MGKRHLIPTKAASVAGKTEDSEAGTAPRGELPGAA
jgi:hypothetical protein